MSQPRRYVPLENGIDVELPKEDLQVGPWYCATRFDDFLEVHQSDRLDGVVVRVSWFASREIRLGRCVILDRQKATQVRDRLNELINLLPEEA